MEEETKQWIDRYMGAYLRVTRRINAEIRDHLGESLTNDQYQILRLVSSMNPCTSTQLAEVFAVGKSSITAIVNRLVEAGILQRTRDEADRRQVYLTITEHGRGVYEAAEAQVYKIVTPYLQMFDEKDVEKFITLFERLDELMQEGKPSENHTES